MGQKSANLARNDPVTEQYGRGSLEHRVPRPRKWGVGYRERVRVKDEGVLRVEKRQKMGWSADLAIFSSAVIGILARVGASLGLSGSCREVGSVFVGLRAIARNDSH